MRAIYPSFSVNLVMKDKLSYVGESANAEDAPRFKQVCTRVDALGLFELLAERLDHRIPHLHRRHLRRAI